MKCVLEHALSVLKPFSFVLKWKRAVSVLSPLSLFSRGGSQFRKEPESRLVGVAQINFHH